MLRAELAKAEDALNRAKLQASPAVVVNVERIAKFSRLMQERMENGEIRAKRDYIASIVNTIEVRENIFRLSDKRKL